MKTPDYASMTLKRRAHVAVRLAIRRGDLVRGTCEVCGTSTRVEAHHDNYHLPLSVRWLCGKHHREHHTSLRRAA